MSFTNYDIEARDKKVTRAKRERGGKERENEGRGVESEEKRKKRTRRMREERRKAEGWKEGRKSE